MKNLVRGGVVLTLSCLLVVIAYAQVRQEKALSIATNSQNQPETKLVENSNLPVEKINSDLKIEETTSDDKNKKGKVEKTVSSRATNAAGSFTATAYCLRGKTASGAGVRKGLIAADRRVLPLGTRINVGAGAYSGNYLVADTGGKIKGRRLDIWMASCAEARRFGRRTVTVGVAGK